MIRLPSNAPIPERDREALEKLLSGLAASQRDWLSGYLAGLSGLAAAPGGGPVPPAAGGSPLTVLYGTESGNAEALADLTAKEAKRRGFKARVRNMAETQVEELKDTGNLLVIVSTWGEGDPPETAVEFHQSLMNGSPTMEAVRFSVCALGDTSYEQFCEIGKQVDRRLEELGGERIAARADCDVDFDEAHTAWMASVFGALGESAGSGTGTAALAAPSVGEFGKKNPFPAEVLEKVLLNGERSDKETWHLELSLEGSGLSYEPGDSLAVVPRNSPDVVEAVLEAAGLDGSEEVALKDGAVLPAREALATAFDVTALSRNVAKKYQALAQSGDLAALLDGDAEAFRAYVDGRQIVDLFEDFPAPGLKAADLAGILRKLPPRLYSIASSPQAHPGEVHLTVAAVRYNAHGKDRKGVASTWLADLVAANDRVGVFVQPNKRFRLPADDATPIIMVGPGTGVAPFRAFVEERAARGATGDAWLFFGDQHYTYDFLYQLEWQEHLKTGALTRLDVAFSRDQPEKVYVQHRLAERARDVHAWLEAGAHIYVCGDASRMAGDVHAELLRIIETEGGKSPAEAAACLEDLKKSGRYQRDVY
ncbi:MAG: assimilatory sulfite reductase (NADPH) flavoprotein subunit [Akkermansiaceae bacterium]|nr:assimilatory sulfite reductase (NADPH) flavoprotein subunit [Akkermansiaceae bacterium]